MAKRGAKPKPPALTLVEGTNRADRHGTTDELRAKVETSFANFGPLKKPAHLKGEAAKAWKTFIVPATWLDGSQLAAAVAFCELYKEFLYSPSAFSSSKHGQMRAYMNELGLTDARNRGGSTAKTGDEFFDND